MSAYFKEELKRAFLSKNTIISLILTYICIFIGAAEFIFNHYPGTNAIYLFMSSYSQGTSAVLSLVFPLLVSIPFASSYVVDVQSGLINYIILRMSRIQYLLIRLLVNGLIGGIVISSALLISFLVFLIIKGFDVNATEYVNIVLFKTIYDASPVAYIMILIFNSFICGFIFSTLGLGLSTRIKNQYLAAISPFLFYILSGTLLIQVNKFFHSGILFDLNYYADLKAGYVLIYEIILLTIGIALFFAGALRNDE